MKLDSVVESLRGQIYFWKFEVSLQHLLFLAWSYLGPFFFLSWSLLLFLPGQVSANTLQNKPIEIGNCIPQVDEMAGTEEFFAKKEAEKAKISQVEVLARLIFSEALSTGFWNHRCESPSAQVLMESIGWGILNRVAAHHVNTHRVNASKSVDPYYAVIFEKNQFRTSFSKKSNNPFSIAFLCPEKAQKYLKNASKKAQAFDLFSQAIEVSDSIISQYEKSGIPYRFQGITNFFYPYSEFFGEKRPPWAKNPIANKNKGYLNLFDSKKPCVEFYKF